MHSQPRKPSEQIRKIPRRKDMKITPSASTLAPPLTSAATPLPQEISQPPPAPQVEVTQLTKRALGLKHHRLLKLGQLPTKWTLSHH